MKKHILALLLIVFVIDAYAAPKHVGVKINQLPDYISVETTQLGEGLYGFRIKVNLKNSSSTPSDWKATLVLKNDVNKPLLSAQLIPSPLFRDIKGQYLSATAAHSAELLQYWFTVSGELVNKAKCELLSDREDNWVVYDIDLSTSPVIK